MVAINIQLLLLYDVVRSLELKVEVGNVTLKGD